MLSASFYKLSAVVLQALLWYGDNMRDVYSFAAEVCA